MYDNPRRITITLDFPAPGDDWLNPKIELALAALRDWMAAFSGHDLPALLVNNHGTPNEVLIRCEHTELRLPSTSNPFR